MGIGHTPLVQRRARSEMTPMASSRSKDGGRRLAFIFPGQGSQYVGMGRQLAANYAEAAGVFEVADSALGFSLSDMCFQGSPEDLALTVNTQPAVLVVSVAVFEALRARGVRPDIVAGHSLGEYSALVAAGALSLDVAVRLVRLRGDLMQRAVPPRVGAMAAVIGLEREAVLGACEAASARGRVEPANFNAPDQVVISGEADAVREAREICLARGARRVVPLAVSGPFHSSMMSPVASALEARLAEVRIEPPGVPVVCNVTGRLATSPDEIRASLARQVSSPVLWEECVRTMWREGARVFVEVGPGKVLSGLVRRIVPEASVFAAEAAAPVEEALEFLKGVL